MSVPGRRGQTEVGAGRGADCGIVVLSGYLRTVCHRGAAVGHYPLGGHPTSGGTDYCN